MAFWALTKHKWFKRKIPDMIYYYKEYVLKTEEQRNREAIIRHKNAEAALRTINIITSSISR